jgi:anti-sigma B factor antagonist/stage II sporulation protein AA (anti-sigma F factor antagonist)
VECSSNRFAEVIVATLSGKLDHPSAASLQAALEPLAADAAGRNAPLVLDFAGVSYISSMGLRVLMVVAKAMRARHQRIAAAALQPAVAEIFAIARFNHVLEVFPGVRDALTALSPPAVQAFDASRP